MPRLASSFPLFFVIAACGGSGSDKQPVTDLPFPGDYQVGKEDSWRTPIDGGRLVLGQLVSGRFDAERGWLGYEIDITSGPLDLRLTDPAGTQALDTILVVYGPRSDSGSYPALPVAINDDAGPEDLGSLLTMEGFAPGTYRVIASTYENLLAWPFNLTEADFLLSARCGIAGDEACGPEIHGIGGACFEDWRCVSGAHCEGEVTCPVGVECIWVNEGTCVEDYEWLALGARQCGTNPWEGGTPAGDDELAVVDSFFSAEGFDLLSVGLVDLPGDVVCQSCACSRGDALVVKARASEAEALVEAFGFARLDHDVWGAFEPMQCDGNPWEQTGDAGAGEIAAVRAWAGSAGIALAEVGFVHPTDELATCSGCGCPRGDLLIARGADQAAVAGLPALGFGSLIKP